MQIKEDKNQTAYGHCTDCNAQLFTRNAYRDAALRKRMRAVTVTVTKPDDKAPPPAAPVTAPAPVKQVAAPVAAPARAKPVKPVAPVAPVPAAKKAGWFSPILGGA